MSTAKKYINGRVSHWVVSENVRATRPELEGVIDVDVAIVGGGLTGLWAAYYLAEHAPDLRLAVLEAEHVGYGASGRNGGWLSHLLPGKRSVYSQYAGGPDAVRRLQRAMFDAVEEVLAVMRMHDIDADAVQSGSITFARNPAALARIRRTREADLQWGVESHEAVELNDAEVRERVEIDGVLGAVLHPGVVRINPTKLVGGLTDVLERRGVRIFENTRAVAMADGGVLTTSGRVRAAHTLICTEGYDQVLLGQRRVAAINSAMIATEPLDDAAWKQIGWSGNELLKDAAHTFVYGQRTADGRIAIGGRGNPYRYASRTGGQGAVRDRTPTTLLERLESYFPGAAIPLAHSWSGVLGVTRDWCTNIVYDKESGIGYARGYAGHGVTTASLAGRTLADLVLERGSDLVDMPWVGHQSPLWEPEPLRFFGVQAIYRTLALADRFEVNSSSDRTSVLGRIATRIGGMS